MNFWRKDAGTAAGRRYALRTFAFMAAYVAVNLAAITGAFDDLRPPGTWMLAFAVTAPVVGQLWATLRLMEESDEFVRALIAKAFIFASGTAIAVASAWGFMETYAEAPHLPAWLVYPLFWASFGLISPFVRTTR